MEKDYALIIKGFKSMEQVREFADWYEGQGEQDAFVWFGIAKEEGRIDVDSMCVDCRTPYITTENSLTITVKPS